MLTNHRVYNCKSIQVCMIKMVSYHINIFFKLRTNLKLVINNSCNYLSGSY